MSLMKRPDAVEYDISVRAIAYLMLGHERHHLATIQTHYLAVS